MPWGSLASTRIGKLITRCPTAIGRDRTTPRAGRTETQAGSCSHRLADEGFALLGIELSVQAIAGGTVALRRMRLASASPRDSRKTLAAQGDAVQRQRSCPLKQLSWAVEVGRIGPQHLSCLQQPHNQLQPLEKNDAHGPSVRTTTALSEASATTRGPIGAPTSISRRTPRSYSSILYPASIRFGRCASCLA